MKKALAAPAEKFIDPEEAQQKRDKDTARRIDKKKAKSALKKEE